MIFENFNTGNHTDLDVYACDRDFNLDSSHRYGPVVRDIYIVECCTDGSAILIINGKSFNVNKGDCIILCPKDIVIHDSAPNKTRSSIWCSIDGIHIESYLSKLGISSSQPFAPKEAYPQVLKLLEQLYEMNGDTDNGAFLRKNGIVSMIFGELLSHSVASSANDHYIDTALHYIETKYFDSQLSVSDIASEIGLDRCYFSTIFKEKIGMSPYYYLSELRLNKARALVLDGNCKISVASKAVGIAPENFSRICKSHTGKTPSEYIFNKK